MYNERLLMMPKHIEFYPKNKFEELVQPVGFIIRIYHDVWSPERQKTAIVSLSLSLSLSLSVDS